MVRGDPNNQAERWEEERSPGESEYDWSTRRQRVPRFLRRDFNTQVANKTNWVLECHLKCLLCMPVGLLLYLPLCRVLFPEW